MVALTKGQKRARDVVWRAAVSQRFHQARAKNPNWTLEAVRDACGVDSTNTVGNWENATSIPKPEMLVAAADFYGVSLDWLLARRDDEDDPDKQLLIEALGKASPGQKRLLRAAAQSILGLDQEVA